MSSAAARPAFARTAARLGALGLLATALPLAVTSLGTPPADGAIASPGWSAWTSSPTDPAARLRARPSVSTPATRVLDVTPADTRQTWLGTGAALTDSSRSLLETNSQALNLLFDPSRSDGARLNLVRMPLSATDFSTTSWSFGWNDGTGTLTAPAIASANAAFVKNQLVPLRPGLKVVAGGWSAPADMKDTEVLNGGSLKAASVAAYGRLLVAQADWLEANGVPLFAMSLGNEPFHSTSSYPTMLMSTLQMSALGNQVAAPLHSRNVQLWAVDHNWEHRGQYDAVLAGAPGAFDAAAFHCYGGSVGQMYGVAAPPVMTECTGTTDGFTGTFAWDAANLIVGAINAGSTGLMMWNLALDENHGPHTGGCSSCRGVVDINSVTGAVSPTPEFYALAHVSRAADPGAVVIGSGAVSGMPYVAFRNLDGRIGIVGHNNSGSSQVVSVAADGIEAAQHFDVGAGELFTVRGWPDVTAGFVDLPSTAPTVGQSFVGSTGGWGPGQVTLTYQWLADGTPVPGATSPAFTPTVALEDAHLALEVTGTRPGYRPVTVTSDPSLAVVGSSAPMVENLSPPQVTGTARVGMLLSVTGGTWNPSDATLSYQWYRDGAPLTGMTAATYRLRPADLGTQLAVFVTASAHGYDPLSVFTAPTTEVVPGIIRFGSRGTVTGTLRVGYWLKASGIVTTPATTKVYRWRRNGVRISGPAAGRASYRLAFTDRGARMSVRIKVQAPGHASTSWVLRRTGTVRRVAATH